MKRRIALFLLLALVLCLAGCGKKEPEKPKLMTDEELIEIVTGNYQDQLDASIKENNVPYTDLKVVVTELLYKEVTPRDRYATYDYYSFQTETYLTSDTLSELLLAGRYDDQMLEAVCSLDYDYIRLETDDYIISAMGHNVYNQFRDNKGDIYTFSSTVLLKNNVVVYISPDADLPNGGAVGDVVIDHSGSGSGSAGKEVCPVCNGSGLIRYYYGDSTLDAIMDGQPDSTVQKCYNCDGTGYVD